MKELASKPKDFSFLIKPLVVVGLFVTVVYMAGSSWDDIFAKKRQERRQPAPPTVVSAPRVTQTHASPAPRSALVSAPVSAPVDPCQGEVVCQRPDGTVPAVLDFLLGGGLKHPGTYQGIQWGPLFVSSSTGYWVVKHKYRATNDYGQQVMAERIFVLDIYGQVIETINP